MAWGSLPYDLMHTILEFIPTQNCWPLRSVAPAWARAVRDIAHLQVTSCSSLRDLSGNVSALSRCQRQYKRTEFTTEVERSLSAATCASMLQKLSEEV